jgi:hypothetical protein
MLAQDTGGMRLVGSDDRGSRRRRTTPAGCTSPEINASTTSATLVAPDTASQVCAHRLIATSESG